MAQSRFAIRAFVGANGGGKGLAMMEDVVLPAWRRGRPVVANLRLYPERLGYPARLWQPLESWRQIPDLRSCELVLDEISSALPSRQAQTVPPQLLRVLNQLRKGDVRCAWSAPAWARCDLALREVTQAVTVCTGKVPDRFERINDPKRPRAFPRAARYGRDVPLPAAPADWDSEDSRAIRSAVGLDPDEPWKGPRPGSRVRVEEGWPPNRLFHFATFDATAFDEFTLSQANTLRPLSRRWYWRTRNRGQHAYSTLEAVELLDHLDDAGACVVCGGHRARAKCSCPRLPAAAQAPAAPEPQPSPATGSPRLAGVGANGAGPRR